MRHTLILLIINCLFVKASIAQSHMQPNNITPIEFLRYLKSNTQLHNIVIFSDSIPKFWLSPVYLDTLFKLTNSRDLTPPVFSANYSFYHSRPSTRTTVGVEALAMIVSILENRSYPPSLTTYVYGKFDTVSRAYYPKENIVRDLKRKYKKFRKRNN